MGSNYFDIPFRSRSSLSDFICPDGEIESLEGAGILDTEKGESNSSEIFYPGHSGDLHLPPKPDVEFAPARTILPGWHTYPDMFPSKTVVASEPTMEYWNSMAAQVLSQFKADADNQNLFLSPFYVVAVWKTPGGGLLSPISPALMIPNSEVPIVGTDGDTSQTELTFKIAAAVCSLNFKFKLQETLRDWIGKIESLEILVSKPLHVYDTFHAFIPSRRLATGNYCVCLDKQAGEILKQQICTETLPLGWRSNLKGGSIENNIHTYEDLKFYPYASIPLGEIDRFVNWTDLADRYDDITVFSIQTGKGTSFSEIEASTGKSSSKSTPVIITGKEGSFSLVTRPLKLSGAGKFKQGCRLYLRGDYNPEEITMEIEVSRDMLCRATAARISGSSVVSIPPCRFRFLRLKVSGNLSSASSLQGFSIFIK